VLDYLGNRTSQGHPMLSVVTCKAIMALALSSDKFQNILLDTGALLHLVEMAVFYRSAASEEAGASGAQGSQKGLDEERRVRLAASSVLSLLAGFPTPVLRPEPNAQVQRVLAALLTPDLVQTLASPSAFVTRVSAHRAQLQPLYKYLEGELIGVNKLGEWPQRQWPFQPLNMSLKSASTPSQRQQKQQQQQHSYANGDQDGDDQQQYDEEGEQQHEGGDHEQGADEPQDHDDDLPDAYASSAPAARVLSPGEKMQDKLSDLGNSLEGAFSSFSRKAANALTPVRASIAKQAEAAKNSVKGATKSAAQNDKVQQAQAGAKKAAAAAAPQVQAAKQAAAPAVAAVQNAASKAGAQAQKAAAAAAPKIAAAKQAAAPKLAAAGAAVGAAASSALSSAKSAAANIAAAAPTRQHDEEDVDDDEQGEEEEIHTSAEFYANAQGDLLSPGGVKSPSTQHSPNTNDQPAGSNGNGQSPNLPAYNEQDDHHNGNGNGNGDAYQQQEDEYAEQPADGADPHGFDGGEEYVDNGDNNNQQQQQYGDAQYDDEYNEQQNGDGQQQQYDDGQYDEYADDQQGQQQQHDDEEDVGPAAASPVASPNGSGYQHQVVSPSGRVVLTSR
jgi:hypothetical protein